LLQLDGDVASCEIAVPVKRCNIGHVALSVVEDAFLVAINPVWVAFGLEERKGRVFFEVSKSLPITPWVRAHKPAF